MSPVADMPSVVETTAISERAIRRRALSVPTTFSAPVKKVFYAVPDEYANRRWLPAVEIQIDRLLNLPNGWDTYSANMIKESSAEAAMDFMLRNLERDTIAPWIAPLADGGLQLEWSENGIDMEVTFPGRGEPDLYAVDLETGAEIERDPRDVDPAELTAVLSKLRSEI